MHLYRVTVNMPVRHGTYYVVADGFDEAATLANVADCQSEGERNGGVDKIEIVGTGFGEDANLVLNYEARRALRA